MKHSQKMGRHAAKPSGTSEKKNERIRLMICCLTAILAVYLLTGVIFGVAVVEGNSMQPTLKDKDVVIFLRLCTGYKRGDIVLVKTTEFRKDYIKRVCALPNETVSYGTVGSYKVDNEVQNEPYIYVKTFAKTDGEHFVTLNEKQYFVMGDNRTNSRDSRDYGGVNVEDIDGKVLLTIRSY